MPICETCGAGFNLPDVVRLPSGIHAPPCGHELRIGNFDDEAANDAAIRVDERKETCRELRNRLRQRCTRDGMVKLVDLRAWIDEIERNGVEAWNYGLDEIKGGVP